MGRSKRKLEEEENNALMVGKKKQQDFFMYVYAFESGDLTLCICSVGCKMTMVILLSILR